MARGGCKRKTSQPVPSELRTQGPSLSGFGGLKWVRKFLGGLFCLSVSIFCSDTKMQSFPVVVRGPSLCDVTPQGLSEHTGSNIGDAGRIREGYRSSRK